MMAATPRSGGPSLIQPVLTPRIIRSGTARFVIGSGPLAARVLAQIPQPARSNTVQISAADFREFCARVPREAAVIYADDDDLMLAALQAVGQSVVYDAREFLLSEQYLAQEERSQPERRQRVAVIATVPRSGTHRLRYFLFALNELLADSNCQPSAHKLYLYYRSPWAAEASKYRLNQVFSLIEAQAFRVGHHLPPGSLVSLADNEVMTALLEERGARFVAACARYPALAALSHTHRTWCFEPPGLVGPAQETRFALIVRDVAGQIESMLTLYELAFERCRTVSGARWTLEGLVAHCRERLRAWVLFCLDGLIPLLFLQALTAGCRFVDLVVEQGLLSSLVTDHAIQLYAALRQQERARPFALARTFAYADMVADEETFFITLIRFLRGAPLNDAQEMAISRAARITGLAGCHAMESDLGHAISYNPGNESVFESASHVTGGRIAHDGIQVCRQIVEARLRPFRDAMHTQLLRTLERLRTAEQRTNIQGKHACQ